MSTTLPATPNAPPPTGPLPTRLSRAVIALSLVSLLTDLGTAMILPLRLVFLVGVLHISLPLAGLVEGVAAGGGPLLRLLAARVPARWGGDRLGIALGYGLSNVARPLLGLVGAVLPILGLTLLDRAGRGLRAAPRDRLLAALTPGDEQPRAFAVHRVLTTVGAIIGPLCAAWVLGNTPANLQAVFLWTALPGVLALVALAVATGPRAGGFSDPLVAAHQESPLATTDATPAARPQPAPAVPRRPTLNAFYATLTAQYATLVTLGSRFWMATAAATVFALGQVSLAFPLFYSLGLVRRLELVPWLYFAVLVVYSVLVAPAAGLAERRGPRAVLIAAGILFALIQVGWGFAQQGWQVWALFLLYGAFLALQEGRGRALALTGMAAALRGSALAWFDGLTAGATILASVAGGWLWREYGAAALFGFAAWLGTMTVALLLAWGPWLRDP